MNPKRTMFFLPRNSLSENFSWVVAGSLKSGALSPTSRAATGADAPITARVTTSIAASPIRLMSQPLRRLKISALQHGLDEIERFLGIPFPWPDGPAHHRSPTVDDQRHRNPADAVFPGNGHPGIEEHGRSEEHTSELQSLAYLVCRLLLEKKKSICTPTVSSTHRTVTQ